MSALTKRELDVARVMVTGGSNKEIARLLGNTEGTIKQHLHSIYRKTGVSSRVALALLIQKRGLLTLARR